MDQIVYQPENEALPSPNLFPLAPDYVKSLNLMMPLGYTLVLKAKAPVPLARRRDSTPAFPMVHLERQPSELPDAPSLPAASASNLNTKVLSPEMEKSMKLLTSLKSHPNAEVFLYPVDTRVIMDYLDYVQEPMDISTIEYNIVNGIYETILQVIVDVKKIWYNAYQYNPKSTMIYALTGEMDKYFDKLLRDLNVPIPASVNPIPIERQVIHSAPRPEPVKRKPAPPTVYVNESAMTMQEKKNLGSLIKKLPHEYLKGVWQIVSSGNAESYEELEFDIETLPVRKARELEQYVKKSFSAIDAKNKQRDSYQHKAMAQHASQNESSFIIDSDSE